MSDSSFLAQLLTGEDVSLTKYEYTCALFLDENECTTQSMMQVSVSKKSFLLYAYTKPSFPDVLSFGTDQGSRTVILGERGIGPGEDYLQDPSKRVWTLKIYTTYKEVLQHFLYILTMNTSASDGRVSADSAAIIQASELDGLLIRTVTEDVVRRLFYPFSLELLFGKKATPILITDHAHVHWSEAIRSGTTPAGSTASATPSASRYAESPIADYPCGYYSGKDDSTGDWYAIYGKKPNVDPDSLYDANGYAKRAVFFDEKIMDEYGFLDVGGGRTTSDDVTLCRVRPINASKGVFDLEPPVDKFMMLGFQPKKFFMLHNLLSRGYKDKGAEVVDRLKYKPRGSAPEQEITVQYLYRPLTADAFKTDRKAIQEAVKQLREIISKTENNGTLKYADFATLRSKVDPQVYQTMIPLMNLTVSSAIAQPTRSLKVDTRIGVLQFAWQLTRDSMRHSVNGDKRSTLLQLLLEHDAIGRMSSQLFGRGSGPRVTLYASTKDAFQGAGKRTAHRLDSDDSDDYDF